MMERILQRTVDRLHAAEARHTEDIRRWTIEIDDAWLSGMRNPERRRMLADIIDTKRGLVRQARLQRYLCRLAIRFMTT